MSDRINVGQCAVSVAFTLALLFVACWIAAYFSVLSASHLFIALFTAAAPMSTLALATGLCSALFFGALAGAVFAASFNQTGRWFQR